MSTNAGKKPIGVVIVEDDNNYREALKAILEKADSIHIEGAFLDAESALEFFYSGAVPRIVLLDIELPGMSGLELLPKIKSLSPNTLVIVLTVFDDEEKIINAISRGANGYILKSAESTELVKAIYEIDGGGAPLSPSIATKVLKMFSEFSPFHQAQNDYNLTGREKNVLRLFVRGKSKNEIAENLFISLYTVDTHIKNIYTKLQVHTQVEAVYKSLTENIV